jgi:hypothetical protein
MDFHDKLRRARRRDRTLTIAKRRRNEHLRRIHFDDTTGLTQVDCVCELANTFFAKRTAFGCGCRKRHHGRPKVSDGLCKIGAREHVLKLRRETRVLRTNARVGRDLEQRERRWPKAKRTPKPYTIEKRRVSRNGTPGAWWTELRRYRTERGRGDALAALRRSVRCYPIRLYREGEEPPYSGPMYEYREAA